MNYDHANLRTLLSAEYVLGLLRGRARQRYERLREHDPALVSEQTFWETRLAMLGLQLAPQIPPSEVWSRIDRRTNVANGGSHNKPPALWDRLGFWQGMALAASFAALAMGVLLRTVPTAPDYVGLIQVTDSQSGWLVTVEQERGELRYKAMGDAYALPAGKDLELWLLVKNEAAPISLGLLPHRGEMTTPLSKELAAKLSQAAGLAVSLEPAGGSSTGAPTGPVLFQAALLPS